MGRRLFGVAVIMASLAGCGGGGGAGTGGGASSGVTTPMVNVHTITVNGGPAPPYPNGVFTSVDICEPGTAICQTVSGILVDTGSIGLRVLASAITNITLAPLLDAQGNTIENCAAFVDNSFLWGSVAKADLKFGGETASAAVIQVVSSSSTNIPTGCAGSGMTLQNTPALLGANGILGIGQEPTDCTYPGLKNYCDGSINKVPNASYWACQNGVCTTNASAAVVPASQQVVNPVILFPTDNNGVIVTFPSVVGTENTVNGTITFGIGTQTNNALGSAQIVQLDSNGNFSTTLQGQVLAGSFLDSGTNAFAFPSSIAVCQGVPYYCPGSVQNWQAITNGVTVSFSIDNADTLFQQNQNASVFSTLGAPGSAGSFDFGLPFFYGRSVFSSIDGQTVTGVATSSPWVAY